MEIDDELLDLFGDDPESLAIVDAVGATQRPAKGSLRRSQLALVAAATVVISIAIGLMTRQASHAGVIERAIHALDVHRVLHLTVVDEHVDGHLIDLRRGTRRPLRHVIDEWYDSASGVRGLRDSVFGVTVTESRVKVGSGPTVRGIDSFVEAYRQALRQRDVRVIKAGSVGGQPVYWLVFRDSVGMEVAIARNTARPVLIRYGQGTKTRDFRVIRWSGTKTVPVNRPRPAMSQGVQLRRLSPSVTPSPSERSDGLVLRNVNGLPPVRTTSHFVAVGSQAPAYEFTFAASPVRGRLAGRYLRVAVAPKPLTTFGWTPAEAAIPEQTMLLIGGTPAYAFAHLHGTYVAIESTLPQPTILASVHALQSR